MVKFEDIYSVTEGGKTVILYYYPQAAPCFGRGGSRNFKIRPDDKNPSCTVFQQKDGNWLLQDKGGTDTKAYNAISLVMKLEGLNAAQAAEWIAAKFAPHLLEAGQTVHDKPKPILEETTPQDEVTVQLRPSGEFTEKELRMLGYKITPAICDELCLKPVDSYITARNAKGKSYKISATENYPMYFYDYGTHGKKAAEGEKVKPWGKIYQPLGDVRFLYAGGKPDEFFFGEKMFIQNYESAMAGSFVPTVKPEEGEEGETVDMTMKELVICSGPSDALNVRCAGYHVCWLNSETADLTEYEFSILQKIAKKIYICYDIDETGIANMYRIALRYLDINIIQLPEELKRFHDRKGKPCKDAKDFFVHFRRPENQNPHTLFAELVRLSGGLKFWSVIKSKTGDFSKFDINNEQLYSFLQASGFYRITTTSNPKGYTFCRIVDNVVTLIDKDAIAATCSAYLLEYLKTHPGYYSQALANTIHRSKQISESSLERLKLVEPNFASFDKQSDYFFFRNCIVKVTANGIEKVKPADCPFMVYSEKIIDHDFEPEAPFFDISYSKEYAAKLNLKNSSSPSTPNYSNLCKQVDAVEDIRRYELERKRDDLTFMQYIYDTGRAYWRKEESGFPLTEDEQAETDLNFISKTMALGYMMSKYKNAGQPYALYAMEMEQADEGEHLGGTGKSLFCNSIEQMRKQIYIDAQMMEEDKMQFMLAGVERNITDTVFMDDLNNRINLHRFMNLITGKMVVNVKHAKSFTLEYSESPKICFTSNHAIRDFDNSLNRRIWFAAFSDYYHSDSKERNLVERSPLTKFRKNLIQDYDEKEMNGFYNFMFNCIQMWKRFQVRIQPPMKQIMARNLQKSMTDEFLWWAEDYFTEERLNRLVNKVEAFEDYKSILSKNIADSIKIQTFKKRVIHFCAYKDWVFNPPQLLRSETEQARNEIRKKENGKDTYYFYIDTVHAEDLPVNLILEAEGIGGAGAQAVLEQATPPLSKDTPIFGEE